MQSDNGTISVGAQYRGQELGKLFARQSNFWNSQIQKHLQGVLFPHTRHTLGDLGDWRALYDLLLKESVTGHCINFRCSKHCLHSETLLNFHSLRDLSNDSNDRTFLIPRHYLIGETVTSFPENKLSYMPVRCFGPSGNPCRGSSKFFWNSGLETIIFSEEANGPTFRRIYNQVRFVVKDSTHTSQNRRIAMVQEIYTWT